jgi:hypothetical protein
MKEQYNFTGNLKDEAHLHESKYHKDLNMKLISIKQLKISRVKHDCY